MSWQASKTVWEHSKQTGYAKLLLLAIADIADATGKAWPSIGKLAEMINVEERSAKRLIKQCEDAGELLISRACGRGNTNEYIITYCEKGDTPDTIMEEIKGDPTAQKGDSTVIKGDSSVRKGDSPVTQNHQEPSENQIEPKETLATSAAEYHEFRQEWARYFPDKAQPRENNKTVQQKLKTRMQSKHFKENWQIALERASGSKFLRQSGFFDVSWFLQNENNYEKCLNGNYDDKPPLFNQNGHHPNGAMDKQQLLSHLWGIVVKFGRRGYHQAKEQLTENQLKILSKIGRWEDIANLSQDDFKFRFYEAYKEAA